MKIYLGEEGLDKSWQNPFEKTTKCSQCGGEARIMFVGFEGEEEFRNKEKYVCQLHETTGEEGGLWFHDAVAVAVYACPQCLEVTALANQA